MVLESGRDLDVIARFCASRIWKHGMGSLGLRFLACMPCKIEMRFASPVLLQRFCDTKLVSKSTTERCLER